MLVIIIKPPLGGRHIVSVGSARKISHQESRVLSKVFLCYVSFENHKVSGTSVTPASQVRVSDMLLLMFVGNLKVRHVGSSDTLGHLF